MEPNRDKHGNSMYPPPPPGYYPYPPPHMQYYQQPPRRPDHYVEPSSTMQHSPHTPQPGFTKIYLGQLPLQITERDVAEIFQGYCQLGYLKYKYKKCRIFKGNSKGNFTRTCYAFLDIRATYQQANEIVKKVHQKHPHWIINLRSDYDKGSYGSSVDFKRNEQNYGSSKNTSSSHYQTSPVYAKSHHPERSSSPVYDQPYRPSKATNPVPTPMQNSPQDRPERSDRIDRMERIDRVERPRYSNPPYFQPPNFQNRLLADYSGLEKGEKKHRILVRELWLGGIPYGITDIQMRDMMSQFGPVEHLEIFTRFAFVRFRTVNDAITAFEKASQIHYLFGKPHGFRIFFSDPEKRTNIVGNHYEYDRQGSYLPILFLGFPPITSSVVDDVNMRAICYRYGTVVSTYVRGSRSPSTRSYILVTFDSVKTAIKAKTELSRRKDLLGDKRVEVALLLDEEQVLKGRNLEYTIEKFQGQAGTVTSTSFYDKRPQKPQQGMQMPQQMAYGMPNAPYHPMPYGYPPYGPGYMPPSMMPMPGGMMPYYPMMVPPMENRGYNYIKQPYGQIYQPQHNEDVLNLMSKVLENPNKNDREFDNNDEPYAGKLYPLIHDGPYPEWSGFMIRGKTSRVAIDCFSKSETFNFQDSIISITFLLKLSDVKLPNRRQIMVAQPSDYLSRKTFEYYISWLRRKECAGVAISYKYLLFILPKCERSDEVYPELTSSSLLIVMEDSSLFHELKDRLEKIYYKMYQKYSSNNS